jgi:hypothetical protein
MLTINNIDKILSINSQDVEVMNWICEPDFYEFKFEHDNIHSTTFKIHMNRHTDKGDNDSYTLKLWDGISNLPLEYHFGLKDVKDPFALLKYLSDVIYDWDIVTNK